MSFVKKLRVEHLEDKRLRVNGDRSSLPKAQVKKSLFEMPVL